MRTLLMVLGLLGAGVGLTACGTPTAKCAASNCSGCCDTTGQCQIGASNAACGAGGALCQPCASSQACTFGQCVNQNTSGGGGGSGGGAGGGTGGGGGALCSAATCATGCCDAVGTCQLGTTNAQCGRTGSQCQLCAGNQTCTLGQCVGSSGGGGGATGGGAGGGGGASSCSLSTCPAGCCTSAGVCITNTTPARCGSSGNQCVSCQAGSTCVSGGCQPCNGCVDISTGACLAGTSVGSCGRAGNFCQACTTGQVCTNGSCFNQTGCNASNCQGCCAGNNTCVQPGNLSDAQCGQGSPGTTCVSCNGTGGTCSASQNRCVFSGTDGGGFGDGGLPLQCNVASDCGTTFCCDLLFGTIGFCVAAGQNCLLTGVCNPSTLICL